MECYICHEPTTDADTSECVCKASVHPRCLMRAIALSRSRKCTICHQPIANVQLKETRRVAWTVLGFATVLFLTTFACCICSLLFVALAVEEKRMSVFQDLLVCCLISVGMAMLGSRFLQRLLENHQLVVVHEEYSFT
jgi:E3 ubiquitin-protein ligase DOA10